MDFIGKHLNLIGVLLLTGFAGAAAGLYFDVPARLQNSARKEQASQQHTCSMHPGAVSAKPDDYPASGMAMVSADQAKAGHDQCGDNGASHHACCATNSTTEQAMALRLPPGHPPIPGWATHATPESDLSLSNSPAHSSHE